MSGFHKYQIEYAMSALGGIIKGVAMVGGAIAEHKRSSGHDEPCEYKPLTYNAPVSAPVEPVETLEYIRDKITLALANKAPASVLEPLFKKETMLVKEKIMELQKCA